MTPDAESPHKGGRGLRRVWNALFYSLDGLAAAFLARLNVPMVWLLVLFGLPPPSPPPSQGGE